MNLIISDKFNRAIDCADCNRDDSPTQLQAWVNQAGLDRFDVDSIDFINDEDVRKLAIYGEGGVTGHCSPCHGADDADDSNSSD